jgi:hypothetical protein
MLRTLTLLAAATYNSIALISDGFTILNTDSYSEIIKLKVFSILLQTLECTSTQVGQGCIFLGVLWIICTLIALMQEQVWSYFIAIIVALITLMYIPIGSIISVVYIIALTTKQTSSS